MSDNKLRMFTEEYENEKTGEKVYGITVMIDGQLKQMLDAFMRKEGRYDNYLEIMRDIIFFGVDSLMKP